MKTEREQKLEKALEFYADYDGGVWENCADDQGECGMLRRCFITGTCHPREIARRALTSSEIEGQTHDPS